MPVDAAAVVAAARGFLGVPWKHQGRASHGLDCIGLVVVTARALEIDHGVDWTDYARMPDGRRLREALASHMNRAVAPAAGRVGLFAQAGAYPSHVGIFGERGGRLTLIHALAKNRKVVEHDFTDPWPAMLRGVFAFPEVG